MAQLVVHTTGADAAFVRNAGTTYATVISGTTGTNVYQNGILQCEAYLSGSTYNVDRQSLSFNTSSIPVGATITSAKLMLYKYVTGNAPYGTVNIVSRATNVTSTADFNQALWGSVSAGAFPAMPSAGYNEISFNTSIAPIVCGGTTILGFRESKDLSGTNPGPTVGTYTLFYSDDRNGAVDAILTVDYSLTQPYSFGFSGCGGVSAVSATNFGFVN
jgi:hypothetical protein